MKPRVAALAMLAVLVAGCGADSTPPASAPPTAGQAGDTPPPLVPAMPLPENAVDAAVGRLDELAGDLMRKSGIPGMAVAVVHGGKTVYAKGFGVKNATLPDDPGNRVDPDTVFQLASVSKSLAATVVAHQVGVESVDWNTPIVAKLPWFALSDPAVTPMVTIGDMMSHRSGLPDHAGDELEDLGYDRRQVLDKLRDYPLDPFRISYAYTNFGFTAGAEAAAVAAGKPWENLAADVLFAPLGMTTASYRYADFAQRPDRAVGHIHVDGSYRAALRPRRRRRRAGRRGQRLGAGHDPLARHDAGRRQLSGPAGRRPRRVAARGDPADRVEPGHRTGDAVGLLRVRLQRRHHLGGAHRTEPLRGVRTGRRNQLSLILPSADVAIVALTNATPIGVPETLTAEFADLVQFGEIRQDWYGLYRKAFESDGRPGRLTGRQDAAGRSRTAGPAGELCRHLPQRLLGRRRPSPNATAHSG